MFDNDLYVEHQNERFRPFHPISGPIPLHRYRKFKKSKAEQRADRIEQLAAKINLPIAALTGEQWVTLLAADSSNPIPMQPFEPALPRDICYPTIVAAKLAIAAELAMPLAKLSERDRQFIKNLLIETLERSAVLIKIRGYFRNQKQGGHEHAGRSD